MAEGWIRYYAGDEVNVYSAGIEAHGLNKYAVQVMMDALIDISGQTSKTIDELPDLKFDYIITLCDNAKENCPYFPGKAFRMHKSFSDPATFKGTGEEIIKSFSDLRDQIEDFCFDFVHSNIRPLIPDDLENMSNIL
jgi:arsenate reductase